MAKAVFDFGVEGTEEHVQKAYNGAEIVKILEETGFEVCKLLGGFNLVEADERSYKIFFIVKKDEKRGELRIQAF